MTRDSTTARLCERRFSAFTTTAKAAWITVRFSPQPPCRCAACRDDDTTTEPQR